VLDQVHHRDGVELAFLEFRVLQSSAGHVEPHLFARVPNRPAVHVDTAALPPSPARHRQEEPRAATDVQQPAGRRVALDVVEHLRELRLHVVAVEQVVACVAGRDAVRRAFDGGLGRVVALLAIERLRGFGGRGVRHPQRRAGIAAAQGMSRDLHRGP